MRSVSLCTSWAGFLLVLALLVGVAVPQTAVAQISVPGVTCTLVDGVTVCNQGSPPPQGVCVTSGGVQTCLASGGGTTSGPAPAPGLGKAAQSPTQSTGTGWLSRLTGWIAYAIQAVFTALITLLRDIVTYAIAAVLAIFSAAIDNIQAPTWLSQYSLGTMLGNTGSVMGFFMQQLNIGAALGLVGAGYAFRLLRKFVTLFQW